MSSLYLPPSCRRLPENRLRLFFVALLAAFVIVVPGGILRMYYYKPRLDIDLSDSYHTSRQLPAHRGHIFDRDGRLLAMSADAYHAYADLRRLREAIPAGALWRCYAGAGGDVAAALRGEYADLSLRQCGSDKAEMRSFAELANKAAAALDMPAAAMAQKLAADRDFVYLRKKISPAAAARLRDLGVKGFGGEYQSQRFYPNGEHFAQLIGYTDYRGVGQSGVEGLRHARLLSQDGEVRLLSTSRGNPLRELDARPAKDGVALRLSVDSRLQYFVYEALKAATARHQAEAAAAIVMDAKSGGLLAVANYPSFNPNNIRRADSRLRNRALSDVVEPGSTVKPFVVALAVEEGLTVADEVLPTASPLKIGSKTIRDSHIREDLTVAGVIGKSSNVGAVLLANRLGKERLWAGYRRLGFGGEEALLMPEESLGVLRHYRHWRREDFATHAYGYGFSTTMLQLLSAYSVFANDGVLLAPRLEAGGALPGRRAMSAQAARAARLMMERVTAPDGTAAAAAVPGYRVAGKTGTAHKWVDGKYDKKKFRAFFVGMAPASRPRYLIAVMVDEPKRNGVTGGGAAAPVFREIMRQALLLGGVLPDAPLAEDKEDKALLIGGGNDA